MGGRRAPAHQLATTAAIAASPTGNSRPGCLAHAAVSDAHAERLAHACVCRHGNAGVGGGQGGHAQGIAGMRAKAHVTSCIMRLPVRIRAS